MHMYTSTHGGIHRMYTSTYVHRLLFRDIFIYTEIGKPQHGFLTAKCVFEQKFGATMLQLDELGVSKLRPWGQRLICSKWNSWAWLWYCPRAGLVWHYPPKKKKLSVVFSLKLGSVYEFVSKCPPQSQWIRKSCFPSFPTKMSIIKGRSCVQTQKNL